MTSFDSAQDKQSHIRNFAIIAHIDHGKSTLADRLMEMTGTVTKREMHEQMLDSNPIERERGITIKLAPVRMEYSSNVIARSPEPVEGRRGNLSNILEIASPSERSRNDKEDYVLNLIDTPGHVDFGYEVSRSLAACEGAILVVDATQGVQAQTLANLAAARAHKLTIIPVINKIDMPTARVEKTAEELVALGFPPLNPLDPLSPLLVSAKTGENVEKVLEAVIARIPPPAGEPDKPLRALVFSSQYDQHKGVVVFVRVVDGSYQFDAPLQGSALPRRPAGFKGNQIRFFASNASVTPIEAGFFVPQMVPSRGIATGEVGYVATGLKDVRFAKVGDTITTQNVIASGAKQSLKIATPRQPAGSRDDKVMPLPGYKEPKPMVFLSLFPINSDEFTAARESMEKLRLSDSAFTFRPISSAALGNGFHCGFLGLLHAEIVQERLSREFDLNMIATAPSVEYHLTLKPNVIPAKVGIQTSSVIASEAKQSLKIATSFDPPAGGLRTRDDKGVTVSIQSATEFPDPTYIEEVKEPVMRVTIFSPSTYVGSIMQLAQEKRGDYIDMKYLHGASSTPVKVSHTPGVGEEHAMVEMEYLIPLADMIIDFFDRLKSISEGYASLDYEFFDYQEVDVVKIDILVNKEKVDALAFLAVKDQAHHRSIAIVERLAEVIPRQQFEIPIQGTIGGQIVARADVKAFRKDVIQKLYGGDRTRKDKLLKKQAKGKAKMKLVGQVQIPQSAFFEVLKRD